MARLKALDLFCCAGGASVGLARAGFDVTGVDIEPQPHYPFRFVQADALKYPLRGFDLIWASPPCQVHSALSGFGVARRHKDLVAPIRRRLVRSGTEYIIENVVGAPLLNPVMLCGSMFGLRLARGHLRRHRLFESSMPLKVKHACNHRGKALGVYGHGRQWGDRGLAADEARKIMGIDWMPRGPLAQAVPPAYAEYLGRQAARFIRRAR